MRICPKCSAETEHPFCPADGSPTRDVEGAPARGTAGLVGQVFEGRYEIQALLGEGGFGAVYRATQLTVGRQVALKLLKAELSHQPQLSDRFRQEARTLAALKHPGIIELFDFGATESGQLFLVMEYLVGEPLDALLRREAPLPEARVVGLAIEALDALADAHHAGIVHRDLKPENFYLAREGRRGEVLKLLDFGIAKLAEDDPGRVTLTGTGMAIGSPRYMSPEQCMALPVTPQSDLYSLGLVLYEAVSGKPVFAKKNLMEFMMAHTKELPAPPSVDGRPLRGPLIDLIMSCLAKLPEQRPRSAADALAVLQGVRAQMHTPSVSVLGLEPTDAAPAMTQALAPATAPATATAIEHAAADATLAIDPIGNSRAGAGSSAPTMLGGSELTQAVMPGAGKTGGFSTGMAAVGGSETGAELAAPRPSRGWLAAAAAVVAALLAGGAFWALGGGEAESLPALSSQAAAPSAEAAPVAARPEPAAVVPAAPEPPDEAAAPAEAPEPEPTEAAPAVAAAPEFLEVTVESEPAGATVWRDGEELGATPLAVRWRADSAAPTVELRLEQHEPLTVPLASDDAGKTRKLALAPQRPVAVKRAAKAAATGQTRPEPLPAPRPTKPVEPKPVEPKPAKKPIQFEMVD